MITSEQINEIAAALVAFQSEAPVVEKAKTVSVKMKSGGNYRYDYAPLDLIVATMRPHLAKHGLAVVQATDTAANGDTALVTTVLHQSGQFLRYTTPLPRSTDIKTHGGNITYIRRYEYAGALGIVTSEDVDALDSGDTVEVQKRPNGQQPAPPKLASDAQRKAMHAAGNAFYGDTWDEERARIADIVSKGRTNSSKQLTADEVSTIIDGINRKAANA